MLADLGHVMPSSIEAEVQRGRDAGATVVAVGWSDRVRGVCLVSDRLRPGGVLHAATDHQGYAEHIAEVGDAEPRLRRVAVDDDLPISVARPVTKYERKALAGPIVTELLWERTP